STKRRRWDSDQVDGKTGESTQDIGGSQTGPTEIATATEQAILAAKALAESAKAEADAQAASETEPAINTGSAKDEPKTNETFAMDVDINFASNRQHLAKSVTQRQIIEATGADISTKGRYYTNASEATPDAPALHLHVEATSQEMLDQAVAMIERLKTEGDPSDTAMTPGAMSAYSNGHSDSYSGYRHERHPRNIYHEKIPVGIESERGFNVRAKLIGTGGENMKYIQNTTGARVQVRGRGSGFIENATGLESDEDMHLFISAPTEDITLQAMYYSKSLIGTIHEQYKEFKEHGPRRPERYEHHDRYDRHERYDRRDRRDRRDRYDRYDRHRGGRESRDNRDYYEQYNSRYSRYSQNSHQDQQPAYAQPAASAAPTYAGQPAEASAATGGAATASYEEYANYYAQYYQYYGKYPDMSAYYAQGSANGGYDPSAYSAEYYQQQQQQQQQQQPAATMGASESSIDPLAAPYGNGAEDANYHSVPPPSSYSNGSKRDSAPRGEKRPRSDYESADPLSIVISKGDRAQP
ncbi:hypothetical protein EC988_003843, partial [Linderina pennispora]